MWVRMVKEDARLTEQEAINGADMASGREHEDQAVPNGDVEERNIHGIQSRYLRCSSPR